MLNFIKRNLKLVIITAVSFVLIAGLTTALIITNTGTGQARGRDRDRERRSAHVELTQEQIAERAERRSERTEGRSERSERTPLTEEQIAERAEKLREKLAQELADGNITQAEYNEKIEAIENGEFRGFGRSRGNKSGNKATEGVTPQASTETATTT